MKPKRYALTAEIVGASAVLIGFVFIPQQQ
jgi:hypothetical protein